MNKKLILFLVVGVMLAGTVEASLLDSFSSGVSSGLSKLDVKQWHATNPFLVNLLMFGALFGFIAYLGLSVPFKENHGAVVGLSIVIGLILGLAAVQADLGKYMTKPFIVNLMFFIVALVLFVLLVRLNIVGWYIALPIALVVTFVIFNVLGLYGGAIDIFKDTEDKELTLTEMYQELDRMLEKYPVDSTEWISYGDTYEAEKEDPDDSSKTITFQKPYKHEEVITKRCDLITDALKEEKKKLEDAIKKNPPEKEKLQSTLTEILIEIDYVAQIKSKGTRLAQRIDAFKDRLEDLNNEIKAEESTLKPLQDEYLKLKNEYNEAKAKHDADKSDAAKKKRYAIAAVKLKAFENTRSDEIENLRKKIDDLEERRDKLEKDNNEIE